MGMIVLAEHARLAANPEDYHLHLKHMNEE